VGAKHPFNNLHHLPDRWTAIDQVADEDGFAIRRPIDAAGLFITQAGQQLSQLVRVTVDITDNVDSGHRELELAICR
jgi:hypothetical protein